MKKYFHGSFLILLAGFLTFQPSFLRAAEVTIGEKAPDFTLTDTAGAKHSISDYKGKFVVLEWNNPDCPFVKKHYSSGNMQNLQKTYTAKGVVWLTINSAAPGKQGSYPVDKLNEINSSRGANPSAYLIDSNGKVGRAYGAKTTPHMFVVNPKGDVIYAGAIDDHPSTNAADIAGSKNYVQAALDEAMAGKEVSTKTSQSYGCSVKY